MSLIPTFAVALLALGSATSLAQAQSADPAELRLLSDKSGITATQIAGPKTVVTSQTRVVPKHVYASQQSAAEITSVPRGYKRVWGADRFNPNRAHQTLAGMEQSDRILSRTVPRGNPNDYNPDPTARRDR